MFELPDSPTDPLKLADWLEICALTSPDYNSSRGDLESALHVAALFNNGYESERIERKALEVFDELEQRVKATGEAYPFNVAPPVLQFKSKWEDFPVYIFCLCLSYFGWAAHQHKTINPRKLFEQVSCTAAERFLQGKAVGFGFPRIGLPTSFPDAVTAICKHIGEGESYREQRSLDRKDDALDLVAWKDFADKLPSKILMFGQCASGWDWEDKITELRAKAFWENWILVSPVSPLVQTFFIPHRVERQKWGWVARKSEGILFDRCRIAYWAHNQKSDYISHLMAWSKDLLVQVTP